MNQNYNVPDFSGPIAQGWSLFMGVIQQFWPFIVGILAIVVGISLVRVIVDRVTK